MNRYNRIILLTLFLFTVMILCANIIFTSTINNGDRFYMVEINRAYYDICENGYREDVTKYNFIKSITSISADSDIRKIKNFFETPNTSYIIKTIQDDSKLYYVKFTYITDFEKEYDNTLVILNACLSVACIIILAILYYVKIRIVMPFNKISEMPYSLSKGHLTKGLKENKNRFFGKFVWGLDMLRESIEEQKNKQLMLEKEKKTLILSMSHDIKTPLSAIKLYTKALSENLYEDSKKRIEITKKIGDNAEKIESFVNDIIKASKEDFLNIEVRNGEFYLKDLITRLENYYNDKVEFLKIQFTVKPFQNCLIFGDIERTLEVFENIIENAVKYGDGKVIDINFNREEDCCLVTVKNSGNTLPDNELVHVFDSFWRGSNTKDKKGSGLGLYICRQILIKMKGDIFAEIENEHMNITVVLKMI